MAKTVKGFEIDGNGDRQEFSGKETRHHRKSEARLIPWTAGPQTRGQKIRRALWG